MITLRNNYSNLLQFKSNQSAKKRNEDKQPTEHKVRHSINNKYSTGVIATTAFIAGLGTGKLIEPTDSMAKTKTEIYAPNLSSKENMTSKDLSWEDATAQQKRPQQKKPTTTKKNRPASSEVWYYTKRGTVTGDDGKRYTEIREYGVHEQQDLISRTLKDANGKVVQKDEFNDFITIPLKEKTTLENGRLYQQKEYEDFNYNLKTPTKGFIKVEHDDGSTDTYDVAFRVNMSLNDAKHTPPTKKQNNNNNNNNNQDIDIEKLYYEGLFGNN